MMISNQGKCPSFKPFNSSYPRWALIIAEETGRIYIGQSGAKILIK
jgi:hypothetical protein